MLRLTCPGAPKILDVGTGAGFIGVALKIAWPEAEVWLLESLQRKYDVLNRAAVLLGLKGLRPVRARAEAASSMPAFDVVLERALAPLPEALELCLPHVGPRGRFLAFQSERPDTNDTKLQKALARRGARLIECWPYRLPREDKDRFLAVFAREGESQGDH